MSKIKKPGFNRQYSTLNKVADKGKKPGNPHIYWKNGGGVRIDDG